MTIAPTTNTRTEAPVALAGGRCESCGRDTPAAVERGGFTVCGSCDLPAVEPEAGAPGRYSCGDCGFNIVDWSDDAEGFAHDVADHEATHAEDLAATMPTECEPWCREGDGHPDVPMRDQVCLSDDVRVELLAEAPVSIAPAPLTRPFALSVAAEMRPERWAPTVRLTVDDERDLTLSAGEALHLAAALTRAANLAGGLS